MLKVGDTVKVISTGTICVVVEVYKEKGKVYYGIVDFNKAKHGTYYGVWYYREDELEKGRLEWIKEED